MQFEASFHKQIKTTLLRQSIQISRLVKLIFRSAFSIVVTIAGQSI